MSNKKKIVILISIISIMILCFSISSFAASYPYGVELHDGDVIVFKDNINNDIIGVFSLNFKFKNPSNSFLNATGIDIREIAVYYSNYSSAMYTFNNEEWNSNNYKTLYINGDQTLTDEDFINWLYENTVSGMPEPPIPPHLELSFWETVSGFFSKALASGTAIVNWMTITPIALIPLALYCLIVIIAMTKRMIKG